MAAMGGGGRSQRGERLKNLVNNINQTAKPAAVQQATNQAGKPAPTLPGPGAAELGAGDGHAAVLLVKRASLVDPATRGKVAGSLSVQQAELVWAPANMSERDRVTVVLRAVTGMNVVCANHTTWLRMPLGHADMPCACHP